MALRNIIIYGAKNSFNATNGFCWSSYEKKYGRRVGLFIWYLFLLLSISFTRVFAAQSKGNVLKCDDTPISLNVLPYFRWSLLFKRWTDNWGAFHVQNIFLYGLCKKNFPSSKFEMQFRRRKNSNVKTSLQQTKTQLYLRFERWFIMIWKNCYAGWWPMKS